MLRRLLFLLAASVTAFAQKQQKVVIIGIDGLSAEAIRTAPVPNMRRIMDAGAYTLKARGVMPTVSSPNWASIIMGAGPEQHGVTSNEWQPFNADFPPVCKGTGEMFPTLFGTLREQRPKARIAAIYDWRDFGRLFEAKSADESRHVKGSPEAAAAAIESWKANQPDLLFLHFDDVDHAGHEKVWHSPIYYDAVDKIDVLVGKVLDAVDLKKTNVILTSDHGGVGTKHGGLSLVELEIPWMAAGPAVKRRGELTQPVYSLETAPTAAAMLGIRPHACWTGRDIFR
jgi:predicted AlkP superfamily pyrophosphatase or phosphodiesterase